MAKCAGTSDFRFERDGNEVIESGEPAGPPSASLSVRTSRSTGVIHLYTDGPIDGDAMEWARWAARAFGRGLDYIERLEMQALGKPAVSVRAALSSTSLTPRETQIVELLASGRSTRDIANEAGLTVSTVNTYLKRVFAKLNVHSRVELVARVAGTAEDY